ncbi:hypothetical protein Tco_1203557 [Tanacetum coccineum]
MSPKAVLLKTGLTPLNTVRPVNIAHPKIVVHSAKSKIHFSKQAQSTAKRPFYKQTSLTRRSMYGHYYTGRPKEVNTARSYIGQVNAVRVKGINVVNSSAYWVWRPTKPNGASLAFKRHNYIDARGRSKQFTVRRKFDGKSDEDFFVGIIPELMQVTLLMTLQDVDNGEPKTVNDAQKQVEDGPNNENAEQERFTDDSSAKDVNASVNTASLNEHDSPEDMFTMGVSSTLEATHIESFSDEDEPEVDLGNITNSYTFPTIPNTRIHKDHPIDNVIGDVKSSVQTRRMTKLTSEQGFLSDEELLTKYKASKVSMVDLPNERKAWEQMVASTPVDLEQPLVKDGDANDVDGSPFELVPYTDSDYAGATQDRKSTTRGCQFLGNRLISWQCKKQTVVATSTTEAEYVASLVVVASIWIKTNCWVIDLLTKGFNAGRFQYLCVPKNQNSRRFKRGSGHQDFLVMVPDKEKGSGPRCQDTILGDVNAQTRFEITSKQSNDPPLSRGYTLGSGEDSMKLLELMELCTQLPKFAEMHNVVAFLEKPVESDRFAEIIDFLKASSVDYALTVNPIIYTSCIEQFWATAKVQTFNGVRQLQALVDKKRVIVMESSIRRDLHLDDAEGTGCLLTATIFEELERMGYEKPSQKLTFYKAFFSPQWKYFIHSITQCLSAKSTAWMS